MDLEFREHSETIKIYLATETVTDPYEKTVEKAYLNPLPIKAIVTDLVASQIGYKMPGIIAEKAKEIIINKRYKSLILQSQKIEIDGEFYEGWKVNGKLQIRKEADWLRIYVYSKQV